MKNLSLLLLLSAVFLLACSDRGTDLELLTDQDIIGASSSGNGCTFPTYSLHPNGNPMQTKAGENISGWDPSVVYNPSTQLFQMYYTLYHGPSQTLGIAYLESTDGITWCESSEVGVHVLAPTPGTWDRKGLETTNVIIHNGQYFMYYMGKPGYTPNGEPGFNQAIGLALSTDGKNWTKQGEPIIQATQPWWEGPVRDTSSTGEINWIGGVREPSVVIKPTPDGQRFEMYYGGLTKKYFTVTEGELTYQRKFRYRTIGYAWSPDGINNWQKLESNPIFTPILPSGGQVNEGYAVDHVGVLRMNNGEYHMHYFSQYGIYHAHSTDGFNFNRNPNNPVIAPIIPPGKGQIVTMWGGPAPLWHNEQIRLYLMRSTLTATSWGEGGMLLGLAVNDPCGGE